MKWPVYMFSSLSKDWKTPTHDFVSGKLWFSIFERILKEVFFSGLTIMIKFSVVVSTLGTLMSGPFEDYVHILCSVDSWYLEVRAIKLF